MKIRIKRLNVYSTLDFISRKRYYEFNVLPLFLNVVLFYILNSAAALWFWFYMIRVHLFSLVFHGTFEP